MSVRRSTFARFPPCFAVAAGLLLCFPGCAFIPASAPSPSDQEVLASPAMNERIDPEAFDHARIAAAIFHETNRVRTSLGLYPFTHLPQLDQAADLQAAYSALNLTSGHSQPFPHLAQPSDRVRHVGLSPGIVAENAATLPLWHLAAGSGVIVEQHGDARIAIDPATGRPPVWHTYASFAAAVVHAWMNSPGHRENLLNRNSKFLGCSGRTGKTVTGIDVIAAIQVFFVPAASPPR